MAGVGVELWLLAYSGAGGTSSEEEKGAGARDWGRQAVAACFDAGKVRKKGAALEHCGRATTATTPFLATSHRPTQGRLSRGTEWPAARVARSFSLSIGGTRKRGIGTRERSRGGGLWIGGREDFWIKGAAIWIDEDSKWESGGIPRWEMSAAATGTNLLEFRVGRWVGGLFI